MDELDAFRREVNLNLAYGALSDVALPVTSDDGSVPVVVAIEAERLSTLLGRIRAVGCYANVFVRGENAGQPRVRQLSVVGDACAISEPDDVMVGSDAPGQGATVGMFVDYLETRPGGVALSSVGDRACARDPKAVEFVGS